MPLASIVDLGAAQKELRMAFSSFLSLFFFFFLFGDDLRLTEVLRLGVALELQLLATATATATPDLHHSSLQGWILNPLSEARDQTYILMGS